MADAKLLEQRLLLRESVVSLPSVSRIATKLRELREKHDEATRDAFIRELRQYQLEASKSVKILQVCDSELVEYSGLESALLEQIADTEKSIQELQTELGQAKQIREHREECEMLSQGVIKFPSRSALEKQTRNVDDAIVQCEQAITDMNDRITQRVTQFKALLQAIADLKGSLKEEEEQLRLAMLQHAQQSALAGADEENLASEEILMADDDVRERDGRGAVVAADGGVKQSDDNNDEGEDDNTGEIMEMADQ
jgi:predicted  nucleic acid-binding Zn-ribbon protein